MAPPVARVRSGNLFEETLEQLLRAIRLGQVAPGSKLPPERDLAGALGVSRTTLREALAQLQDAGYVTVRRGRYGGTYVGTAVPPALGDESRTMDADAIADLLTLRRIVETGAAELAASRELGTEDRERLWAAHLEVCGADVEHYRPLDSRLHLLIAELSGSRSLLGVVADTRAKVNDLLDRIPLLAPNLDHSSAQHEVLVRCILDGDPEGARRACLDHLEGTAALLRGFLG
jgi:DNA-binding FadR family transcriptional regulator